MTLLASVLGAVGVALAFAAPPVPVDAKGPSELRITGAGLDGPLHLRAAEHAAAWPPLSDASRWWTSTPPAAAAPHRPASDELGPRLVFTWTMTGFPEPEQRDQLVQHVHPYAPGGPVVSTPSGQSFLGVTRAAGWHRAGPELVEVLRDLGVPSADALARGRREELAVHRTAGADRLHP